MKNDQRGALGIDAYVGLMVVIFCTIVMMAGLGGMARLMDARADAQQVANLIAQRYRDEGCLTANTVTMVKQMMVESKMKAGSLSISGATTQPVAYGFSTMVTIKYKFSMIDWTDWALSGDIPIPIPIYSQYAPQALAQQPVCVTSLN